MSPALPFPEYEYRQRRERVRDEMAARGIDVLYVTSPPNLLYLTGYQAGWYPPRPPPPVFLCAPTPPTLLSLPGSRAVGSPPRLPVGVVLVRDAPDAVVFDWV